MKRKSAAVQRRAKRLKHFAAIGRNTHALGTTMMDLMVSSALAPLHALSPTAPNRSNAKVAEPKAGRSLRVVLGQLRAARALVPAPQTPPTTHKRNALIPKGALFLTRRHRGIAGSRGYKLYMPTTPQVRPKGLVVMLHGCNQTPDDFARGTHMNAWAHKHGLAVAYPAQTRGQNAASCWNWFQPAHQSRNTGEPAILAALTRKLMKEFGLKRDAVFVAGLSAGGAMAAILANEYPDVFSAAGVHSGLARGAASNALSAMLVMHNGTNAGTIRSGTATRRPAVRWIIFQGEEDQTVHPSNAANLLSTIVGPDALPSRTVTRTVKGRSYVRTNYDGPSGVPLVENWLVKAAGHAWSGGRESGSYADPEGPDASAQMIRFFLSESA